MAYIAFSSNSSFCRIEKNEIGWGRDRERVKGKEKLHSGSSQVSGFPHN